MADERLGELKGKTRYEPGEVEARVFAEWVEGGYFHPKAEGTPAENFSVAIPPPNVTGALHMGHALNGAIQDALAQCGGNRTETARRLGISERTLRYRLARIREAGGTVAPSRSAWA